MTKTEFIALANDMAKEAGVEKNMHDYFRMHTDRLWATISHFGLHEWKGKNVLEMGAFFCYTPFLLASHGNTVTVLEGDDPAVYPLKEPYAKRGIKIEWLDITDSFSDPQTSKHRLPFADNQFDAITCWETMEHFNFNPVGFVKDVHRILKPGGIAALTVPNRAKLDYRLKMLIGRPHGEGIDSYYQFYGYPRRFLGWHWREYTLREFEELFVRAGFEIVKATHLNVFQNRAGGPLRNASHVLVKMICAMVPSGATNCALTVRKKP